jgi:hypothetical protein
MFPKARTQRALTIRAERAASAIVTTDEVLG